MAGLASLFGYQTGSNPLLDFLQGHSNTLLGLGAGIAGGGPDLGHAIGQGLQLGEAGKATDTSLSLQMAQRNAAADWLAANGHPELATPVRAGAITGADAFNVLNKQTVVPPGSTVIDGQGNSVTPGGTGGFIGNDLKSQAWNTVMKANAPGADPALKQDPKFVTAWAIATEPTMTPQGMMQPQIPAGWGPSAASSIPAAAAPAPSPSQSAFGGMGLGSDVAPIGAMANAPQTRGFSNINPASPPVQGPGVIPGTQPFNESQGRTTFLANSATPDLQRVVSGFPALMNPVDQAWGAIPGGGGRIMQSPQYKQASDAMKNSMVNLLYFASGANINKDEWARKAEAYIPVFGDDPQTAVNKLDRFANDVISLANTTKDPQTVAWAQQAVAGIKQTEQQILSGGSANMSVDDLVKKYGG